VEWAIIAFDYIPWSGKLAFHLGELCSVEIQARQREGTPLFATATRIPKLARLPLFVLVQVAMAVKPVGASATVRLLHEFGFAGPVRGKVVLGAIN
jgi:hypothetical protein